MAAKLKLKACKTCGAEFRPFKSTKKVCSVPCAVELVQSTKKAKAEREFNRETKRLKKKIKTKSDWIKEVQVQFNKFIRLRDHDKPCISCGKFEAEPIAGRMWDCGHFLSTGSNPELRFNEFNAHRQHSRCNRGAAKSALNDKTVSQQYEINLRERIGDSLVDWLKGPHDAAKFTIEELQFLKAHYSYQAKELQAAITSYMGEV